MALKPTIFKFDVSLADMDRDCYESLALTVAQHPSETTERMWIGSHTDMAPVVSPW